MTVDIQSRKMQNLNLMLPKPPAFLSRVPKSVFRKIDVTHTLWFSGGAIPNALGCYVALSNIISTLDAAKVQQRRIVRAKKSIFRLTRVRQGHFTLFHDVHFYLICWARIAKLTRFVTRVAEFPRAKSVLDQCHTPFKKMSRFRNHLEHFEERLPGGSRQHLLKVPGDLFNIGGEYATIGGEKINVGSESLSLLIAIVEAFKAGVLYDALEAIATTDQSRVLHLIRQAAMQVDAAQMVKYARKTLNESSAKV